MAILGIKEESLRDPLVNPSEAIEILLMEYSTDNPIPLDGSTTPIEFTYSVPAGKIFEFSRLMIGFESAGNMDTTLFGDGARLTNGVQVIVDNLELINWKSNAGIKLSVYDTDAPKAFAKESRQINARFTMRRAYGNSIKTAQHVKFVVNDNLEYLVAMGLKIQGKLRDV